jgi:hypothetical protein
VGEAFGEIDAAIPFRALVGSGRIAPGVKKSLSHASIDMRMSKGNGNWFASTGL